MLHPSIITTYQNEIHSIFKENGPVVYPSPEEIIKRIELNKNLPDTCFHVVDLRNLNILYCHGTERIFGIPNSKFTYAHFAQLIHPSFTALFMAKAVTVYRALKNYHHTIHPDHPHYYNVFVPLALRKGAYFRVRQMSLSFGLDSSKKMTLQLNIYRTGFEPYEGQPMSSFFSAYKESPHDKIVEQMQKDFIGGLQNDVFVNLPALSPTYKYGWNLSNSEMKLLKIFAEEPSQSLNFKTAAQRAFISESHARGIWNKELKEKMNRLFAPRRFNNIRDVAIFMRRMDVI